MVYPAEAQYGPALKPEVPRSMLVAFAQQVPLTAALQAAVLEHEVEVVGAVEAA